MLRATKLLPTTLQRSFKTTHIASYALISPNASLVRMKSSQVNESNEFHVDYYSEREDKSWQMKLRKRLSDVLSIVDKKTHTFPLNGTVGEAMFHLAEHRTGCSIALDEDGQVEGIFTARDITHYIHGKMKKYGTRLKKGSSLSEPPNANGNGKNTNGNNINSFITTDEKSRKELYFNILDSNIKELITTRDKLVICSPEDTVREARKIMFQHKIRHIPVLDGDEIIGILNAGDLSDSTFSIESLGGKKAWMEYKGRVGLPEGTRYRFDRDGVLAIHDLNGEDPVSMENNIMTSDASSSASSNAPAEQSKYVLHTSEYALPHPYKTKDGVGNSRRDYGPHELCDDLSLCEDASFIKNVKGSFKKKDGSEVTYMCVADGVGSWRKYDVDPRLFAHNLVENVKNVIENDMMQRESMSEDSDTEFTFFEPEPIHPLDAIMDAYSATRQQKIVGSSTICLASIDNQTLTFSNIGDCGLMVLRHFDSETAGSYMRERNLPRHLRKNDLRIAFLSQQQLKAFNYPYQLGYSELPVHAGTFESPTDATTFSLPISPGDIILMATDGLFDNIDIDDIVNLISEWETSNYGTVHVNRTLSAEKESEALQQLCSNLVGKARELSLDDSRDSPFALLAKDNDIMWSGGMPDDTSVIVARVAEKVTVSSE